MPIALIDLLNSREDAILFWAVAILAFVVSKDPRGIGSSFLGVLRAVLGAKAAAPVRIGRAYSALFVVAGMELGLWHTSSINPTIYWFFGTAIVLVGYSVTHSPSGPGFVRGVLKRVVVVTIIVDFIVNLNVFPFAIEFVLVFLAVLFVGMEVVVRHDPSADQRVRRLIDWVLVLLGVLCFGYFAISALRDLDGFLTKENADAFLVGPVLTIALIPLLYVWAWISQWEQRRIRRRFIAGPNSAA